MGNSMGALVLAAGFGTRLQPLTNNTPKCLMTVGGLSLLEHVLRKLESCAIESIIVNTHYLADQVQEFLECRTSRAHIQASFEASLLGTGGTLLSVFKANPELDHLLVINADLLTPYPLNHFLQHYQYQEALLAVQRVPASSYVLYDDERILSGLELPDGSQTFYRDAKSCTSAHFLGVQCVSRSLIKDAPLTEASQTLWSIYGPAIEAGASIRVHEISPACYWTDVGTPAALEAARRFYS